jgi:hypothetical protein
MGLIPSNHIEDARYLAYKIKELEKDAKTPEELEFIEDAKNFSREIFRSIYKENGDEAV